MNITDLLTYYLGTLCTIKLNRYSVYACYITCWGSSPLPSSFFFFFYYCFSLAASSTDFKNAPRSTCFTCTSAVKWMMGVNKDGEREGEKKKKSKVKKVKCEMKKGK